MEEYFLFAAGFIGTLIASVQDIKEREIDNVLNFSILIFGLVYGAFRSILSHNYFILLYAVLGFLTFLAIGNLFYYSRMFAGGDAKLLIALGPFIFAGSSLITNFEYTFYFILLFLLVGSVYGIIYSASISLRNFNSFSKYFKKEFFRRRILFIVFFIFFVGFLIAGFYIDKILFFVSMMFFIFPILFSYARAAEKSGMIKEINYKNLREGDWLYKAVKIRSKMIKPSWEGLSKDDISAIKKAKKNVVIREGIPFVPAIFIAYVLFAAYFFGWVDFSLFGLFA